MANIVCNYENIELFCEALVESALEDLQKIRDGKEITITYSLPTRNKRRKSHRVTVTLSEDDIKTFLKESPFVSPFPQIVERADEI